MHQARSPQPDWTAAVLPWDCSLFFVFPFWGFFDLDIVLLPARDYHIQTLNRTRIVSRGTSAELPGET